MGALDPKGAVYFSIEFIYSHFFFPRHQAFVVIMGAADGRAIVEHWYTCLTPTQFTTASCGCFWSLLGNADGRAIAEHWYTHLGAAHNHVV